MVGRRDLRYRCPHKHVHRCILEEKLLRMHRVEYGTEVVWLIFPIMLKTYYLPTDPNILLYHFK
jgi:hypothetical protein